jgi:hypothetical protein
MDTQESLPREAMTANAVAEYWQRCLDTVEAMLWLNPSSQIFSAGI